VAVSQSTYIAEELAEVERGIDIEQIAEEGNSIRSISKVKHVEEEASSKQPLHYDRIQHKPIENTHSQTSLGDCCSDALSKQPKNEPIRYKHIEVKPYQCISPEFKVESKPKEAETC
jgi:hypothetical protein